MANSVDHSAHSPPLPPLVFDVVALTDPGMRRLSNQDSLTVVLDSAQPLERGHILMVADGMGGHAAGELASKLAVDQVALAYRKATDLSPPAALRKAVHAANDAIHAKGQSSPDLRDMGTTCSCLVLLERAALVAHVGDSRVYRLRGEKLEQLTFDHSLVWEMAAANQISTTELPSCIPKNVITRSLGPHPKVIVDLEGPHDVEPGDVFLLCSDGLTGVIDDELLGAMIGSMPPKEVAPTLIDLANLRGGPDNISVIVAKVAEPAVKLSETATHVAQVATAAIRPWVWTWGALSLAGIAWFSHEEQDFGVFVSAICFAAALAIGFVQRHRLDEPQRSQGLGGPYGNGPYRNWNCQPGPPATAALKQVVEELGEMEASALDTDFLRGVEWGDYHRQRTAAESALTNSDHSVALAAYAAAIRALMAQVRMKRGATVVR